MSWGSFWTDLRTVLHAELFQISGTSVTTMTLLTFVLVIGASFWISRILRRAVDRFLRIRGVTDEGTIGVSERLTHYLVLVIGLGVAFQTLGIQLTALFAAGAFVAVAAGSPCRT